MKTIKVEVNGHVGRWRGGTYVAVWREERADQHVPDLMLRVPDSLKRSRATSDDIRRVVEEGL
jgi:hypothetical protein